MIVLDTNVVSEAMKPNPDTRVLSWLDAQIAETLYLTSISIAELKFGVGVLPEGRRKKILFETINQHLELFQNRTLPFDASAANCHADLAVAARVAGEGFPTPDGYIAAIAVAHDFSVATRDGAAFNAAGVRVINPWA